MKFEQIRQLVGNTPHLRVPLAEHDGIRLWIKLEGANPTGSIKDRACVFLMEDALKTGRLTQGKALLDASSGNMACAIAYYGGCLGYEAVVVANSKLTKEKREFIEFFGATLHLVGDFTIQGNQFCAELAEKEPERYCFLDQLHNWSNPRAHIETTGPEILADFPDVALVVGSLGSGGSLLGTAQHLKSVSPGIAIAAVQSASGTKLPGTGAFDDGDYITPFIRKGFDEEFFDHRVKIHFDDAVRGMMTLRERGVFTGLQTGGVVSAALATARELGVRGDVVVLSGDTGWKNMEALKNAAAMTRKELAV
jgi:[CysO sulfur-carrier protein]-thiocarboxylate-dependent cysteine synthase